jgi:hypothetical protein
MMYRLVEGTDLVGDYACALCGRTDWTWAVYIEGDGVGRFVCERTARPGDACLDWLKRAAG